MKYSLIFVVKGMKVLLINRFNEPIKGLWTGLGGHYDSSQDYDMFDCAKRELFEESGLSVDLKYLKSEPSIHSDVFYGKLESKCSSDAFVTDEGIIYWYDILDAIEDENKGLDNITKKLIKQVLKEIIEKDG